MTTCANMYCIIIPQKSSFGTAYIENLQIPISIVTEIPLCSLLVLFSIGFSYSVLLR